MRIAVCDDSSVDLDIIADLLKLYFSDKSMVYKISRYDEGQKLICDIEEGEQYDIVFLDIYINREFGIDVAEKLRALHYKGAIVFLTVSSEYAIASYDVMASGYLLKPHSYEKLKIVMNRILNHFEHNTYAIRHWSKVFRIPYNDIMYVESSNNRCIIHCSDGEKHTLYKRLDVIAGELDDIRFLRCHQSYLVNMNHIRSVEEHFILYNGETILIRRKDFREIRDKYLEYIEYKKNNPNLE